MKRLATLALLLAVTLPVRADDAAAARFFDEVARREFAARRYPAALEAFLHSHEAAPNARTLFNIALAAELARESATALTYYIDYLASADQDPDRRTRAEQAVERLRARVTTLEVTTDPPGATIYLDRAELGAMGTSPRSIAVEPGEHLVIVELQGHERAERVINVSASASAEVSVALQPLLGSIHVEASAEAMLTVTREEVELARGPAPLDLELPVGRYRVRAESPEHEPAQTTLIVEQGRVSRARLELRPRPAATGRLLISTGAVLGADVRLDGRWVGRTPLTLSRTRAGERRLEVWVRGYSRWVRTVTVRTNSTRYVAVRLRSGR